jgi:hypothetical protein
MREAERCTDVTNAVVGEADGAAVLAERAQPFMRLGSRQVRWARDGEIMRTSEQVLWRRR